MQHASRFASLVLALMLFAPSDAGAAPQILGLVASVAPTPLTCAGETCSAEFTAFCLQKARVPPRSGTPYAVAKGGDVRLLVTTMDGHVRWLPAAGLVGVASARGHTAVTISIARRDMEALGAVRAAIEVGRRVSLVPVPEPGDPWPLTGHDVSSATGPLRAAAANLFDGEGENAVAARITNRLINALPVDGRMAADQRRRLWRQAVGTVAPATASPGGHSAARIFAACGDQADAGAGPGLRRCLEMQHDGLMLDLNSRYWTTIDAGS